MRITIRMSASETSQTQTVDLEDLGFENEDDWKSATEQERDKAIRDYCFSLHEQPYWVDDSYSED